MKYCCFLAAVALVQAPVHAQGQAEGHPDLGGSGVWLPDHVADAAAKIEAPFQAWAKLKFDVNGASKESDPDSRCLPPGLPRITFQPRPFEIVQTANRILFVYEGGAHIWRQAWMDGRAHPKDPNPNWLGHSIGHWDGDALVVDSVGFNDKTWLDDAGHPHTERLHVIERYTRTGAAAMKYEATIDDPGAYTRPWKASSNLSFRRGAKLAEDICLDKISK